MTTSEKTRYEEAVGRRKTSTARVRITKSSANHVTVNGKTLESYFPLPHMHQTVLSPIVEANQGEFKVTVKVSGGGIVSQSEAVRHGIARALIKGDITLRSKMKPAGFLKRDPRMKERRKFGLKKARKAPQWAKR